MRTLVKVVIPLLGLFLMSCAHDPTTVSEADLSILDRASAFEKSNRPITITGETIVLDVRAFFDYQISRIPNALWIDAREFSLRRRHGDDLEKQASKLARRLALMGVTPFSHVVVVGYGDKGRGEEGVVALTLLTLGVERVQMGNFSDFKSLATTKAGTKHPNQRYWEPRVVSSVICPLHDSGGVNFVIDVGPTFQTSANKLAHLSKDWKDFINKQDFSPNHRVKEQLRSEKIGESTRFMVRGAQAPTVVFALLQMGYTSVCMLDD